MEVVEFLIKVLAVWKEGFTWFVGVLMVSVNLAFDEGLVSTYAIAFTIITWAIFADFFLGFINAAFNKNRKIISKRMGDTVIKMTSVFFTFLTLAAVSLITYQTDSFHLMHLCFHASVLLLTTLVVSREAISLLETAEDMGLPGAKVIKEKIDALPNLFSNEKGGKGE